MTGPALRTLAIGIALAVNQGLAVAQRAQDSPGPVTPSQLVVFFGQYYAEITNACGQPPRNSSPTYVSWYSCAITVVGMEQLAVRAGEKLAAPGAPALAGRSAYRGLTQPDGGSPFTPTLSSSTPYLPFLGNRLVEISYVLNGADPANTTAVYLVGLGRESDCSMDQAFVLPGATPLSAEYLTSLPSAQDYLHQLAGLTTTPDVFAKGCDYQVLGLPATNGILLLGTTADGAAISAQLTNNGNLLASLTDLTANTVTKTTLTGAPNGFSFSAASLRGNGIKDIVELFQTDPATHQPATAVFLGNGDGTFKPPVYYDAAGDFDLTIDDVNGDGIPDIVVAGTGTVTTLIGKGDGTFTMGPGSTVAWSGNGIGGMVTGDFNGDGKKDLLIGATVLFGGGDGTFTQGPTTAALASAPTSAVGTGAVGDLRNNGKLDVVVSEMGSVAIFYGNGDGTFATGPRYAGPPDEEQVTITDIDGDGNPDIVLGSASEGIFTLGGYDTPIPMFQILMGRGDGTFVDSLVYNQGFYNVNGAIEEIASADFTGDGKLDVLVLDQIQNGTGAPSQLVVLPGDGKGNLGTAIPSPINFVPEIVVEADMNGDGKPDAVVGGLGAKLAVLINQGNGTFAGEQDYTLPSSPGILAVGDFNGDGLLDVAVGGNGVYVLFGQANGTLGTPVQIGSSLALLAAGSLTMDGRTDLVVAEQGVNGSVNGPLHVYLGNADGTFTAMTGPTTSAANYTVAALGDLNNDGKLDLVVAGEVAATSTTGSVPNVYTLLGNGDGTFQAAVTLPLASADGLGAGSIALADFNHDGNLDVVVGNDLDYTEVLLGNGDGTLDDTVLALGQRPGTVAAADLLRNGFPELLVGQPSIGGSNLIVFLNSTTGWTAAVTPVASTTALAASPTTITVGASVTLTATVTGPSGNTTVPTGTVTFMDGATALGPGTLNASGVATYTTTALPTGSDSITAVYAGDANFNPSTSAAMVVTVNALVATATALTASPTSALTGVSIGLSATVTPASGAVIPTGTVTFYDGVTSIGSGALDSSGVGTFSTTTLAVSNHSITAQYGGSASFAKSTSTAVTVTITAPPPDFSLRISPTSGTETGSAPASATLTLTPVNSFTATVNFACSGLPPYIACSFSPSTLTPAGAALKTTVTFTDSASARLQPAPGARPAPLVCLAFGFGFLLLARARKYRTLFRASAVLLFALAMVDIVACGSAKATPQTNTVTITATSGALSHTTTYTLTSTQ